MKRHRPTNRTRTETAPRSSSATPHADGVWAQAAAAVPQTSAAPGGSDQGRAWTRYIDSRLKQFGSR